MKICWDNIDEFKYIRKTGNLRRRNRTYYFKICRYCGEEYFGRKGSDFCCKVCSNIGENNPMYGKEITEDIRQKMSESHKGFKHSEESIEKMKSNSYWKGKHHTEETKNVISKANKGRYKGKNNPMYGKHHTEEVKKTISNKKRGIPNFKLRGPRDGGYRLNGIPKYDTYAPQLDWCEEVRRNADDPNVLEVRCTHCDKWYVPKIWQVKNRIYTLNGYKNYNGEGRFYCSDACKQACPLYHKSAKTLMKEDAIRAGRMPWADMDREVQPELRQMVLARDNYECQKCGSTENLQCHHILPVAVEPLLSADVDNCITLCEECHKAVHQQPGCRYSEIRTEIC
jgi:5-methylcytosine-specific restriction endonuclease McrA